MSPDMLRAGRDRGTEVRSRIVSVGSNLRINASVEMDLETVYRRSGHVRAWARFPLPMPDALILSLRPAGNGVHIGTALHFALPCWCENKVTIHVCKDEWQGICVSARSLGIACCACCLLPQFTTR